MSLLGALSVSASGMAAQRSRAEVIAENMANAETTRTRNGGPYRRKQVVFSTGTQATPFSSVFQDLTAREMKGVSVEAIVEDAREPELRYVPGHPDANADGYVAFPRVDPTDEMVDLLGASRGYQANVSAALAVRDMIHRSIDLMR